MAVDGVPMVNYGTVETINPLTTVYIVLYPVPDYISTQEFLYEDDVTRNLFLHRISGDIVMGWETEQGNANCEWAVMPLGVEYDTISVLEPFAAPWFYRSSEWVNLSHWSKRQYLPSVSTAKFTVDHPWWTWCEVKPRRLMGVRNNMWPILACRNNDTAQRLLLVHTLKAWYS